MKRRSFGTSLVVAGAIAMLAIGAAQSAGSASGDRWPASAAAPGARLANPVTKTTAALPKTCGPQAAWIGSGGDGVACLDATGWKLFDEAAPFPRIGSVKDIAVCRSGVTWMVGSSGLVSTDGRTWTKHALPGYPILEAVACDAKGRVWLAGYNLVASYDGSAMTTYPVSKLGTGRFVNQVKDVAVAPDGRVWFATANSIASYDGSAWKAFEKGRGLDKEHFFNTLAVDASGRVWAASTSSILRYDGTTWTSLNDETWQGQAIAVDGRGRVWVGTYGKGVAMFDGQSWTMIDRTNSALPSDHVKSLAVDARSRLWVGTAWGLGVLTGRTWQVYHVSDSDIPANEVEPLGVVAGGPRLPARVSKPAGGLKGRLVRSGAPQAGLDVELCVEYVGMLLTADTPCTGQPFHRDTTTGSDGSFRFAGIPAGDYVIAFRNGSGKWYVLSGQFGLGSSSQEVLPGKTTDLGQIDLSKSK